MQKGFALITIIILLVAASTVIIGGSILAKNTFLKNSSSSQQSIPAATGSNLVDIKIHILNVETQIKCRPEGVKLVTDADLQYTQAVTNHDQCVNNLINVNPPEASMAANQATDCNLKVDQAKKSCTDQVNKNLISLDQFESCTKKANDDYKTCLQDTNSLQDSVSTARKNTIDSCNQILDQATSQMQSLIKQYCIDSLK